MISLRFIFLLLVKHGCSKLDAKLRVAFEQPASEQRDIAVVDSVGVFVALIVNEGHANELRSALVALLLDEVLSGCLLYTSRCV